MSHSTDAPYAIACAVTKRWADQRGGLDSSSTAVLAARELHRQGGPPPPGFAWPQAPPTERPRNRDESIEYGLIESVCRQEGIAVAWCPPSSGDWLASFRWDVTLGQAPGGVAPELAVQRRAAELGVRVLLSGWGGDEVVSFHGRGYHEELLLRGRLVRWPGDEDPAGPPAIIIQCKRQRSLVSKIIVKSLYADVLDSGAASGLIVTTSRLAPGAKAVCRARGYPIGEADRGTVRRWVSEMRKPGLGPAS